METWKPFPGSEDTHEISSIGRVKTLQRYAHNSAKGERLVRERILKPFKQSSGYLAIRLSVDAVKRTVYVHRAVCEAWHGPPNEDQETRHANGNKHDNRHENLSWGTRKENISDNAKNGTLPIGERHGHAKLSEVDVRAILSDKRKHKSIASDYRVSLRLIGMIKRREIWKHVKENPAN